MPPLPHFTINKTSSEVTTGQDFFSFAFYFTSPSDLATHDPDQQFWQYGALQRATVLRKSKHDLETQLCSELMLQSWGSHFTTQTSVSLSVN